MRRSQGGRGVLRGQHREAEGKRGRRVIEPAGVREAQRTARTVALREPSRDDELRRTTPSRRASGARAAERELPDLSGADGFARCQRKLRLLPRDGTSGLRVWAAGECGLERGKGSERCGTVLLRLRGGKVHGGLLARFVSRIVLT